MSVRAGRQINRTYPVTIREVKTSYSDPDVIYFVAYTSNGICQTLPCHRDDPVRSGVVISSVQFGEQHE